MKGKGDLQSAFVWYPSARSSSVSYCAVGRLCRLCMVEEMVEHFAGLIFGKNTVQSRCIFRVTRNADITVDEGMFDHDVDYREIMSDLLKKRRKLAAVRLQTTPRAPAEIVGSCAKS